MTLTLKAKVLESTEMYPKFWNVDWESGTIIRRSFRVLYSYAVDGNEYRGDFKSSEPYTRVEFFSIVVDPSQPGKIAICGLDKTPTQWVARSILGITVIAVVIYLCFHFNMPTD
jgi:hypothetical protein